MQCPACGFENMPGRQTCGLCSGSLEAAAVPESVFPPRARDRGIRDRIEIASERGYHSIIGGRLAPIVSRRPMVTASGFGRAVLLLACVVPGMGQRLVMRDYRASHWHLGAGVIALTLAVALYQHRISDVLLCVVAGLSIASVLACVEGWRETPIPEDARLLRRVATVLLTISVYASAGVLVMGGLTPFGSIQNVVRQTTSSAVSAGDSVLVRVPGEIRRGDTVAGLHVNHIAGIGPVVGLPGETVGVSEAGAVTINGRVMLLPRRPGADATSGVSSVILGPGEYWVPPTIDWYGGHNADVSWAQTVATLGVMRRGDITGRAVAIVEPPERRGFVHRLRMVNNGQ